MAGAAGDEWTLRENRRAFDDFRIEPKRLRGVSPDVDLSVDLLGHTLPFPFFTAPMGAHGMVHEEAEVATARGTGLAGTLYCSSGASHRTLEEIAQATQGPKWFQLYWNNDIEVTKSLLSRARDAGYSAIVLTADALGPGMPDQFKAMGADAVAIGEPLRCRKITGSNQGQLVASYQRIFPGHAQRVNSYHG